MNIEEALGQIALALAQPDKATRIKAILEKLIRSQYTQGHAQGYKVATAEGQSAQADLLEACELVADNVHSGSIGIEFSTWQKILAAVTKAKGEAK